jgi:hypothetical protein
MSVKRKVTVPAGRSTNVSTLHHHTGIQTAEPSINVRLPPQHRRHLVSLRRSPRYTGQVDSVVLRFTADDVVEFAVD